MASPASSTGMKCAAATVVNNVIEFRIEVSAMMRRSGFSFTAECVFSFGWSLKSERYSFTLLLQGGMAKLGACNHRASGQSFVCNTNENFRTHEACTCLV